jgi:hypothetical protein
MYGALCALGVPDTSVAAQGWLDTMGMCEAPSVLAQLRNGWSIGAWSGLGWKQLVRQPQQPKEPTGWRPPEEYASP